MARCVALGEMVSQSINPRKQTAYFMLLFYFGLKEKDHSLVIRQKPILLSVSVNYILCGRGEKRKRRRELMGKLMAFYLDAGG